MIKVNNMPLDVVNGEWRYVIVRDCGSDGYWYWGADNDLKVASTAAREIGNGFVVTCEEVEEGKYKGYRC